jgi:hypothetical protein
MTAPSLPAELPGNVSSLHAHARPDPANPAAVLTTTSTGGRVPGDQAPRSPEPARFRLMHHAHLCQTSGDSIRLTQALAGKGVIPLN